MKRLLIIIALLSAPAWSQSFNTHLPAIPIQQSETIRTTSLAFDQPVTSGNLLIAFADDYTASGTPSFSDSRCPSWTQLFLNTSNQIRTAVYGCFATSSGADTVSYTWSGTSQPGLTIMEFPPYWTLTVDATCSGSCAQAFTGSASPVTSPVATAATNHDLLLSFVGGFNSGGISIITTSGWAQNAFATGNDSSAGAFSVADNAGNYSTSWDNSGNSQGTVVIVGLQPNALSIVSPATAPDGSLTNAYDWTLRALGGVGSFTWSITAGSLQSGLSLNTSTGEITGTPTGSSTNSITFHVTDGTNTANKTISLKVGATANTPTDIQDKAAIGGCGACTSLAFTSNVTAGDEIITTNSNRGAPNGLIMQYCSDTLGTPLKPIMRYVYATTTGSAPWPVQIFAGVAPSSGADTVTCAYGMIGISEWSGINYAATDNTLKTIGSTASGTITSSSLTTLVPNELLYTMAAAYVTSATVTLNSPYTQLVTNDAVTAGYDLVSTVTGYTSSYAISGNTSGGNTWVIGMAGFRPSASAPSATATRNRISVIQH